MVQQNIFVFLGCIVIIVLWKMVFNLRGKKILGLAIIVFISISIRSFFWGVSALIFGVLIMILIRHFLSVKNEDYSPAEATFETNEILRGLSAVEAGYFIGLDQNELFLVAILELMDKGVLLFEFELPDLTLSVSGPHLPPNEIISPAERTAYRNNAAKKNKIFLRYYDDLILEMLTTQGKTKLGELDVNFWFKFFLGKIQRIEPSYQIQQTREYASRIIDQYVSNNTAFSRGKAHLSGWYAAAYFSRKVNPDEKHHPSWIGPGDDFHSIANSMLDILDR